MNERGIKTGQGSCWHPQMVNHDFQIGSFDVGFAPSAAVPAEVIDNEVNVPIVVIRHN